MKKTTKKALLTKRRFVELYEAALQSNAERGSIEDRCFYIVTPKMAAAAAQWLWEAEEMKGA